MSLQSIEAVAPAEAQAQLDRHRPFIVRSVKFCGLEDGTTERALTSVMFFFTSTETGQPLPLVTIPVR